MQFSPFALRIFGMSFQISCLNNSAYQNKSVLVWSENHVLVFLSDSLEILKLDLLRNRYKHFQARLLLPCVLIITKKTRGQTTVSSKGMHDQLRNQIKQTMMLTIAFNLMRKKVWWTKKEWIFHHN